MAQTIYTLYTCDAWKTYSSMSEYWIGTSFRQLIKAIKKGLRERTFSCSNDTDSVREQVQIFNQYLEQCPWWYTKEQRIHEVAQHIDFGYISINTNNSFC